MTNFDHDETVMRFARQLRGMGVDEALRARGAAILPLDLNLYFLVFVFICLPIRQIQIQIHRYGQGRHLSPHVLEVPHPHPYANK